MLITDKQKYAAVLEGLGEVLEQKNLIISSQEYTIRDLRTKLEAAESEACNKKALAEINGAILDCIDLKAGKIIDIERLEMLQSCIQATLKMGEGGAA